MLPRSLSRREMIGLPTLRLPSRPRSSSFSLFFSSSTLPSDRSNKQTFYPQTPTHTYPRQYVSLDSKYKSSQSTRSRTPSLSKKRKKTQAAVTLVQGALSDLLLARALPVTFFQRHNPAHFFTNPPSASVHWSRDPLPCHAVCMHQKK